MGKLTALARSAAWLPATLLVGALPGLVAWQIAGPSGPAGLAENELGPARTAVAFLAASALAYLAALVAARALSSRRGGPDLPAIASTANRLGALLAVVPIYLFLSSSAVGDKHPFFAVLCCLGAAGIGGAVLYRARRARAPFAPRDAGGRDLAPLLVVLALAAAYAVVVGQYGLLHHRNLGTRGWDLGIYVNTMWHSLRGDPLGCSLIWQGNHAYRHFDPILILLSPILLIREDATTLIVFQSVWAATGAVPLYLIGRRLLRNGWAGALLAAAYLLHPAFHGPSVYDFHSLFLAGPLLLWCVCALEHGWTKRFFVALALVLMCREEMPVLGVLIGVWALLSGKPRRVGWAAIAVSAAYGLVVYFAVVVHAASYTDYFEEMSAGDRPVLSNVLLTLATNPVYLARYMLTEAKIVYVLKLAAPLLMLPLFSGRYRVLFLLGLGVTLLGSKACFTSISMQYSTWWLPFMLASVPAAVENVANGRLSRALGLDPGRLRGALLAGVLLCTLLMSAAYGIFWPNHRFRTGYEELERRPTPEMEARYRTILKMREMIPDDASVWATSHVAAHFATRDDLWVIDILRKNRRPDYYVVWWEDARSKKKDKREAQEKMLEPLRRGSREYELLLKENGVSLFRRR